MQKKQILAFSGLPHKSEAVEVEKDVKKLEGYKVDELNRLMDVLDIPRGDAKKEGKIARIMDFLKDPKVMSQKNKAEKKTKTKKRKKAMGAKRTTGAAAPGGAKKPRAAVTSLADDDDDEDSSTSSESDSEGDLIPLVPRKKTPQEVNPDSLKVNRVDRGPFSYFLPNPT